LLDEIFTLVYYGRGFTFQDITGRTMSKREREYFLRKVEATKNDETKNILEALRNLKL